MRRKALRLGVVKLANELGVSYQQMLKCEKGENRVSAGRLWRIAAFLQCPVSYFYEDVSRSTPGREEDDFSLDALVRSPLGLRILRALDDIDDARLQKDVAALVEELAASAKLRKKP